MEWRRRFTPAALCLLGVVVTACGQESSASPEARPGAHSAEYRSAPAAQSAVGAAARAPASTPPGATPTGTPLYTRLASASAVGDTGQALTAALGGVAYRGATGVWVGCEGTAASAVYRLGGEFTRLTGVLGLQPHTPDRLQVRISIVVDGESKFTTTLRRSDPLQNISVPLKDARSVTVNALAVAGQCAPASSPYGAIGTASLT